MEFKADLNIDTSYQNDYDKDTHYIKQRIYWR